MSTEIIKTVLPKELAELKQSVTGISADRADQLISSFVPAMTRLTELSLEMESVNFDNPTPEDAVTARKIRLKMVPERTGTGRLKDSLKEDIKRINQLNNQ